MEFKHPKYYAALRAERRKLQAASVKQQATSKPKPEPSSGSETSSHKLQASSYKQQA